MEALSAADLLDVWEQGASADVHERAMLLLAHARPEVQTGALGAVPLGRRDAAPATVLERLAGRAHGPVHVRGAGVGQLGDRTAGGRVERLEGAPVGGLEALAADDQSVRPGRERAGGVGEGVRQG